MFLMGAATPRSLVDAEDETCVCNASGLSAGKHRLLLTLSGSDRRMALPTGVVQPDFNTVLYAKLTFTHTLIDEHFF